MSKKKAVAEPKEMKYDVGVRSDRFSVTKEIRTKDWTGEESIDDRQVFDCYDGNNNCCGITQLVSFEGEGEEDVLLTEEIEGACRKIVKGLARGTLYQMEFVKYGRSRHFAFEAWMFGLVEAGFTYGPEWKNKNTKNALQQIFLVK